MCRYQRGITLVIPSFPLSVILINAINLPFYCGYRHCRLLFQNFILTEKLVIIDCNIVHYNLIDYFKIILQFCQYILIF